MVAQPDMVLLLLALLMLLGRPAVSLRPPCLPHPEPLISCEITTQHWSPYLQQFPPCTTSCLTLFAVLSLRLMLKLGLEAWTCPA